MVSLLLKKVIVVSSTFVKRWLGKKREFCLLLKAVSSENVKSPKCAVPLSCGADQLPLGTLSPGRGSEAGGAQGGD